jgi:hypothetical protein
MRMPLGVMTLFMRSLGAPDSIVSMIEKLDAEGFDAFAFNHVKQEDPNWEILGADPNLKRSGIWLQAAGPNSRLTLGVFFEGENDEVISSLTGAAQRGDLPSIC